MLNEVYSKSLKWVCTIKSNIKGNLFRVCHYNATFHTRMRMEQLSNELFKWLRCQNFCLLCEKGKTSFTCLALDAPLAPPAKLKFTPICASACPKRTSAPLCWKATERKERPQTILWSFGINGKDCVSKNSGWHYHKPVSLHCSHHNLNVSIHDGICLRLSVSVATNYSCYYQL